MAPTRTAATLALTLLLLLVVVGPTVVPVAQPGTATAASLSDERRSSPQVGQLTIVETDDATVVGTPTATDESLTATPTLSTATVTITETATPTATPIETATETQIVIDDTTSDLTNTTEDTTSDLTNTTDDTTTDLTNTTDDTTSDLTNTTEDTTSDLTNTTDDTTSDLTNTTDDTTSDLTNTTEDTTSDLTNTTEDTTSGLTNTTENVTGDLAEITGTLTETTRQTGTDDQPSETAATDNSTATAGSNETTTENRTAAVTGPADDGTGGGMPQLPNDRETIAVGALAVAGLAAAAASKQAAVSAAVTPPADLQLLGQTIRQQVTAVAGDARDRLGQALRVILPFGYSQHDDSDPLEHDVRRSLFEQVEREPGVNLSTLAEDRAESLSTVRHHLRILSNERLVTSEKIRGRRRYFPQNESEPALTAALDDEATAPILRTLARTGPATVSDLADAMGRDPSTISYHLSRLDDDGLVERERDGQAKVNRLAPVADRALASEGDRRQMATD